MFESMVIGSVPRIGKRFALRPVLLAAVLDPGAWVLADLEGPARQAASHVRARL